MALGASLSQGMEQSLSLTLTPSQKLSLEILQLNIQNLEQRIEQELESNPLLEVVDDSDKPDPAELQTSPASTDEVPVENQHIEAIQEYLEPLMGESDYTPASGRNDRDEGEDDFVDSVPAKQNSLEDSLREQLDYINPRPELKHAVAYILSHLDQRGYLGLSLEELADGRRDGTLTPELLHEALDFVHVRLDPPGIGARDIKECLLLQIRHLGGDFELEERVLKDHFDQLLANRLDTIAAAEKVPVERVVDCLDLFRTLELRPASMYSESVAAPLRPDAMVRFEQGEDEDDPGRFLIKLNLRGVPELVVIPGTVYKSQELSAYEKRYIMEKSQSGRSLIEAIRRRNETLALVIQAICQRQIDFFRSGRNHLSPLLMQDIARDVGLSAATITRTVKDKVVQTDDGVFPLRYFFSVKKVKTSSGTEQQRDDIFNALKVVVDGENKRKPYSDAGLAKELSRLGHPIATRTVSKYRDMLNIPSSSKRKQY